MNSFLRILSTDGVASVVVLLVALPLCLGIALGSHAPLSAGIVAGIVGGIVIGSLSGSQLSVSGPAAGLTVIVASALQTLPSFQLFLVSVILAGILQLFLGTVKAGIVGDYIPNSVIKGMLAAIGILLILKQFPHLVGYNANYVGDESFFQPNNENTFSAVSHAFLAFHPTACLIGLLSLVILILLEQPTIKKVKALSFVPAPLIVVIVGATINAFMGNFSPASALGNNQLVNLPVSSHAFDVKGILIFPDFSGIFSPAVWSIALTLGLVASLETLLSIEAVDKLDPLRRVTPTNRELIAQGVGNITSGFLGGLPITSVIVRSSANLYSGASSKLSTISHGVLLALCVLTIPHILNTIPLSALAAVLIFTGYKLAKVSLFKEFYTKGSDQFVPFVFTITAILLTDLLKGILFGIAVGLFYLIKSNFHASVLVVKDDNRYLMRFRKNVSFLNKPIVKRKLEEIPENASLLIDTTHADFIDHDVKEVIQEFLLHAHLKNVKVELKVNTHKPSTIVQTVLPAIIQSA